MNRIVPERFEDWAPAQLPPQLGPIALDKKNDDEPEMLESMKLVLHVLAKLAPRMVEHKKTEAESTATTETIQSRLKMQLDINATPLIDDPDKGREALDRKIRAQFGPAKT